MEAKNYPIEKEKHLPSTSIIVFHVNLPGCNHPVVAVFGLEWKFLPDPRRYLKEWRLIRQPGDLELESFAGLLHMVNLCFCPKSLNMKR